MLSACASSRGLAPPARLPRSFTAGPVVRPGVPIRRTPATCAYKESRGTSREASREVQEEVNEAGYEFQNKANEVLDTIKTKWNETPSEERPAAVALTIAAFTAVWATSGVVNAIDRLPVIGDFLEFIGLVVTAWFGYRYLTFSKDREELKAFFQDFTKKVQGK